MKGSNYQIACARFFELTHKLPAGSVNINHPNQYFEESQKAAAAEKGQFKESQKAAAVDNAEAADKGQVLT